jgi:hypothetical protein
MPTILDQDLYDRVRREADKKYEKPSAYKSGWIVKTYKERGGRYADDNKPKDLKRWFKEEWGDIGGKEYPVYRPHKRVSAKTPLTADEIDPKQAKEQIKLKQEIKGSANLPKFEGRGTHKKYDIKPYTYHQAKLLDVKVFPSDNPKYKIEVYDGDTGQFLFYGGDPDYSDFPTYAETHGLEYAKRRRKLYWIRHAKEPRGSRGWYIKKLLW